MPVCRVVDVPRGKGKRVDVLDHKVALFREGDLVYALSEVCPHKMGPLSEGTVQDGCVRCPWHGWAFSLATGDSATRHSVPSFDVRIFDGEVFVSLEPKRDYEDFAPPLPPVVERTWYGEPADLDTRIAKAIHEGVRWLAARGVPLVGTDRTRVRGMGDVSEAPGAAERRLFHDAMEGLDLAPRARVLDIGCGSGLGTVGAAAGGASVIGITLSDAEVGAVRKRVMDERPKGRVSIQIADAARLPYPGNSFDAVVAFDSLSRVPRRGRALREIARVMKRGARIAVLDATLESRGLAALGVATATGSFAPWSKDTLRARFERAGLSVREEEDLTPWFRRAVRKHAGVSADEGALVRASLSLLARAYRDQAEHMAYVRLLAEKV